MSEKTKAKNEYTLTMREAKWLAKSLEKRGSHFGRFKMAYLFELDGQLAIATTDLHRMHVLKLGAIGEVAHRHFSKLNPQFPCRLFDLRRAIHEASFNKRHQIVFDEELNHVQVTDKKLLRDDSFDVVVAPLFPHETDKTLTPSNLKAIIPTDRTPASRYHIDYQYLIDALSIKGRGVLSGVHVYGESPMKAQVFTEPGERWIAVVMPMAGGDGI